MKLFIDNKCFIIEFLKYLSILGFILRVRVYRILIRGDKLLGGIYRFNMEFVIGGWFYIIVGYV